MVCLIYEVSISVYAVGAAAHCFGGGALLSVFDRGYPHLRDLGIFGWLSIRKSTVAFVFLVEIQLCRQ